MSDPVDLQRVIELDQAATPGPWRAKRKRDSPVTEVHLGRDALRDTLWFGKDERDDADLIAFYRDAAPAMARTLLELREASLGLKHVNDQQALLHARGGLLDFVLQVTGGES